MLILLYRAIDDLYQKNACFSKLKLFFSMRCIRLNTVLHDIVCVALASSEGALLQSPSMHTREKRLGDVSYTIACACVP